MHQEKTMITLQIQKTLTKNKALPLNRASKDAAYCNGRISVSGVGPLPHFFSFSSEEIRTHGPEFAGSSPVGPVFSASNRASLATANGVFLFSGLIEFSRPELGRNPKARVLFFKAKEGDGKCHIASNKSPQRSQWSSKSPQPRPCATSKNSARTELKNAWRGAAHFAGLISIAVALTIWTNSSIASASPEAPLNPTNAVNAIIGEAESEPIIGKVALAEVIRNKGNLKGVYGLKSPRVRLASRAVRKDCELAWAKKGTNLTHGATVWGNRQDVLKWESKAKKNPRHWFNRMKQTAQIGRHYFFREVRHAR